MKDMDYIKDRFRRLEDRLDLVEGFLKWMFQMDHRRSSEQLRSKDGSNRDEH